MLHIELIASAQPCSFKVSASVFDLPAFALPPVILMTFDPCLGSCRYWSRGERQSLLTTSQAPQPQNLRTSGAVQSRGSGSSTVAKYELIMTQGVQRVNFK